MVHFNESHCLKTKEEMSNAHRTQTRGEIGKQEETSLNASLTHKRGKTRCKTIQIEKERSKNQASCSDGDKL